MKYSDIFNKKYVVGIDIGSSSVKMAQFVKREDGLHLIKIAKEEIADTKDKNLYDKEAAFSVKNALKGVDIKKSKFIVVGNCPETRVRNVTAPYMPKAELEEGIRLEARNYFSFSVEDALLDYEILGEVFEKGIKKYQLLVATSPKQTVSRYLALLSEVGIKPVSLIPAPYAMQKLASVTRSQENSTYGFLDIGSNHTELIICKGKHLVFSRSIPVAGSNFTEALTHTLVSERGKTELTLQEAEKIKCEVGIPYDGSMNIINDKISTTHIVSMLRPLLEQLANETERCFGYYREETAGEKVNLLMLYGGGSSLKGLTTFLSEELGIKVMIGNPLEDIKSESAIMKTEEARRFSLAIGAALTEGNGINLLPAEIKQELKRTITRATIESVATVVFLTLIFLYIGMRIELNNFQKRIAVANMELSGLKMQLNYAEAQMLKNKILENEPYWEEVFKELSNLLPQQIYLTELSMKGKTINMKGEIMGEGGEKLLSSFLQTLEKGLFKDVKLIEIKNLPEQGVNVFQIECWVD
jgi:type IV pilus assembly protein PilM